MPDRQRSSKVAAEAWASGSSTRGGGVVNRAPSQVPRPEHWHPPPPPEDGGPPVVAHWNKLDMDQFGGHM